MPLAVVAHIFLVIGMALLIAECFIPGFGVCGALGLICAAVYAVMMVVTTSWGGFIVAGELAAAGAMLFFVIRYVRRKQLHGGLILSESLAEAPREAFDFSGLIGRVGRSKTSLRPQGAVDFNGSVVDARSESGYLAENTPVLVTGVDGSMVVVRKAGEN
ncbi:MAG: hypothetical protein LBK41_05255 [Clostridiales bacterium]|jgi:membrane-bound serine protease (ClpP class)|nr:hypothetical protein [Clostridiales bacterium]